ncbi:MAG: hypothetical protein EYC68_08740 [Chloroflexota bacterium]|nr:MAG: hypothetical protein EYC68_08740 [Chloroflexota bacterium]
MPNPEKRSSEILETRPYKDGFLKFRDWLALAFVVLLPFIFYWRAALGLGMFFFGDIARFFFPTRVLYANALQAGRLPLWQPEILAGIPLLAEMQTGALYPLHLLLYRLLPVEWALNYDILLHLAFLGAGMFLFARVKKISTVGAMIAAIALTMGGFGAARITHPNVLSVAAWLPWLLYFYEQWHADWHRLFMWALLVIAFALQWLGGHPQFALINCVVFGVYVVAMEFMDGRQTTDDRPGVRRLRAFAIAAFALVLGTLIAAAQILPTFEFAQQSARAGGVDQEFFTTFSYHPLYLALLSAPFLRGNPYPNTSVEVIAYLGILPLLFAFVAVILKRDRETWFWIALALGALLLAFGGNTPLYPALRALPLFNLFRVPARFLFPFAFALAMLAGFGFDVLRARTYDSKLVRNAFIAGGVALALALLILILTNVVSVEGWLDAWRALPIIFGALALLLVLRAPHMDRVFFTVCALGLTLIDVMAFSAVYAQTYNQIAPRAEIFPRPRVLGQLNLQNGARVLTSEWILPWIAVMNESLFPNLNAAHNVRAAHGYTPLTPRNTRAYLDELSPVMLNKLGVRYYLIPQLLPVDPKTEAADLKNPFLIDPVSAPLEFSIVDADGVEMESSLAQSAALPNGAVVAEVVLTDENGKEYRVPLLAGRDTAEWAYERSDVLKTIQHARPEIASSFPARSAFPIEEHVGHTFLTRLNFADAPAPIVKLRVEPKIDAGLLHIQKIALLNGDTEIDLAPLVGKGRHSLVYRSEDVAVFENPDASPRAFVTHNVKRADDAEAFRQLRSPAPSAEIFVAEGPEFDTDIGQGLSERADIVLDEPERVVIETHLDSEGYLVLTDAWDPEWIALVDGKPMPIARADVIFRAVLLTEGTHRVEFLYRPRAFYIGLILSGVGIALLGIALLATVLVHIRQSDHPPTPV